MHIVEASSVAVEGGDLRPFLPATYIYMGVDGEMHRHNTLALLDSGATRAIIPARFLPPHAPAWAHLSRTSGRVNGVTSPNAEVRIWMTDVEVFGVRVCRDVMVLTPDAESDSLGYPVLGLDSVFAHFNVAFAFGSIPPVIVLRPQGQVEPLPTTRWRVDHVTNTWEGVVSIDTPALPAGMRVSMPANRETRRRLGVGR